jgi:hypothetical protein
MPYQALDWDSDASTVQHFSLADHVVILGGSQIRLQGAPEGVLHSSRQILKTIIDDKEMKTSRQLDEPYSPGKLALCDINLEVKAGQSLILCGRTGKYTNLTMRW